jgi:hypothetical protein
VRNYSALFYGIFPHIISDCGAQFSHNRFPICFLNQIFNPPMAVAENLPKSGKKLASNVAQNCQEVAQNVPTKPMKMIFAATTSPSSRATKH